MLFFFNIFLILRLQKILHLKTKHPIIYDEKTTFGANRILY